MEKPLNQLVEKLKEAGGSNVRSVVLYGSAARGDYQPKHSDLNVLCVLGRLRADELEKLNPVAEWWTRQGHPAPLLFTLEELRQAADVFAIELHEIRSSRRILYGDDVFAGLDVPMKFHWLQVERELRTNLLRLRQNYLSARRGRSVLIGLMAASVSSFLTLFRHALIALGVEPPSSRREVVGRLAGVLGFDPAGIYAVLDLREGKPAPKDLRELFGAYLDSLTRVTEEVDRRFGDVRGDDAASQGGVRT